ncbi:50S ribosomal protein L1 [Candidatus Peribacteria bacterium RIFCSPLOWO2_12_FULL_55_15]|nr:MAG: 50S ribosomal protein L1 [Candidatus Peribacteria bacterium RIFCSPHIGHO2_01_FULL_54_22]OGJ62423.1 MAG: 50S ribosomal protein L1 [Candidatus Peribacteria bacterium RIFCSPHIGHO2_02_FULL_55_24]OGJ63999.1 MAG: 50S ribosomal protein L1 [Candidatus Peribacteria bacterium RIFCSPHIGHO2_12_FULL_54_10]OGJ68790.1 MAG: 50S ribosomal protein L1 [Candidatus Peribacteria bacterium RIFCSPLOWO2_01_FULL_54_110]OGJ69338.1 MAG: 50S ribosomal protein L1 [Candidatus Peribacteria bacterium RIFCSPLOWO2_02_FULL
MPSALQKSHAKKRGKKYLEKAGIVQLSAYILPEAVALLTKVSTVSFDATAEVHFRINADPTQADQIVRTVVDLPHGTGKTPRIAAFVPDDLIETAKKAGALKAGNADLIREVEEGKIDFDIAIAVPKIMKDLGKVAKILGQRGLMPNPKAGTVTENVAKTIEALRKGRTECKMDTFGIIHTIFGKISFGKEKLQENLQSLVQAIEEARPAGIKDPYIRSITITPTMGPGIRITL